MRAKVILFSSDWSSLDGQSIVTNFIVQNLATKNWILLAYRPGISGIKDWAISVFKLYYQICKSPNCVIYIVPSRSIIGYIRDLPVLIVGYLNIKIFAHIHGTDFLSLLDNKFLFARHLYKKTYSIIVPSNYLICAINQKGLNNTFLLENISELECDSDLQNKLKTDALEILWNSNIISSKGFFDLVMAIEKLVSIGYNIRLTVLGKSISDQEMSQNEIISKLAILQKHKWFKLVGPVKSNELSHCITACDAIILPSRYSSECQPLAIINAMTHGKHVIISDIPALIDTIGSYPAIVVNDIPKLIEGIITLYKYKLNNVTVPIKYVDETRKRFSKSNFLNKINNLLSY